MANIFWYKITTKFNEIIERRKETLYLTVRYDCSFNGDFYMEFRKTSDNRYILYHSTMGSKKIRDIMRKHFIADFTANRVEYLRNEMKKMETYDFKPFIGQQFMDKDDAEKIFNIMLANEFPSAYLRRYGLDGGTFYIKSYFDEERDFLYYCRPSKEYNWIVDIVAIMGKNLPAHDRERIRKT